MRIVHVQVAPLLSIKPNTQPHTRMLRMAEAGLLRPEAEAPADTPVGIMGDMFGTSMVLCDLEEQIKQLTYPKVRRYLAPKFSIPAITLIYVFSLKWAFQVSDYGDRLWRFGMVWWILSAIAVAVIVVLIRGQKQRRRERLSALTQAKALKKESLAEFEQLRERFLVQNFVAPIKGRLVAFLCHDAWLVDCLRETPAAATEVRDALQAARDGIDQRLAALRADPPESWTSEGLSVDTQGLAQMMADAGIRSVPDQPTG